MLIFYLSPDNYDDSVGGEDYHPDENADSKIRVEVRLNGVVTFSIQDGSFSNDVDTMVSFIQN